MVLARFAARGEDVMHFFPLACPDSRRSTAAPIQVVGVGPKDDYDFSCHVLLHMAITKITL
jgi:hypothetical protein